MPNWITQGQTKICYDLNEKGLDMQHSEGQGLQVELTIRINTIVSYPKEIYYNSEGQSHCLFNRKIQAIIKLLSKATERKMETKIPVILKSQIPQVSYETRFQDDTS